MVILKHKYIRKNGKIYDLGTCLQNYDKPQKSERPSEVHSEMEEEMEPEEDNMFLTGTNEVVEPRRKIRSSKSYSSYDYFKQQANEILGN